MLIPGSVLGRRQGEPVYILKQADWSFWKKVDRVPLVDAVILSVDLDPETEPRNIASGNAKYQIFKTSLLTIDATSWRRLERRARIVLSSIGTTLRMEGEAYDLSGLVRLPVFGDFADAKGLQIPKALPRLHPAAAHTSIGWPWGPYETPHLRALAEAGKEFFSKPHARGDEPKSDAVADWLHDHGVPQGMASIIARIFRDPGTPAGPRREPRKK